jgi:glycosyltransferase involved in cell wall biosynthesis
MRRLKRLLPEVISIGILHNVAPHERFPASALLTRYVLHPLQGFLLLSEAVARDLERLDRHKPRRIHLHPPFEYGPPVPRDEARRRLGLPAEAPIALFFGLVRPYKGVDILIEALPHTPASLYTVIAGEWYIEPAALLRRVDELKLSERVRIDNRFITREEIPLYFCASDIIVQPYRSATQSGVTPLAFRYERPVVVTNVGGLWEYVQPGRTGYVVEPTPTAIAEALTDFVLHNRGQQFAPYLREAARQWRWEGVVETLDELVAEISARRSGRQAASPGG